MKILTVTQLNMYIKSVFEEIPPIQNLYITGEISNFKHYYQSGHFYFTLKDANSQLKCVMFSSDNYKLKFKPENGMNVVCFGQVGVYERDGVYQLYVRDMQPKGVGELAIAFEQLKQKLDGEGLFDETHKKPIPRYPTKIGVATSNVGAAVEDIKNVISRRYPLCEIIIVPTLVQGELASADIVKAIKVLDSIGVDTIIVGRGGGSIEDLWAFNTEPVARAVYECKTPIISAVGHETDYTICDFVADLRAPTPSAAAELAVPDIRHESDIVNNLFGSMEYLISRRIEQMESSVKEYNDYFSKENLKIYFDSLESKISDYNKLLKQYSLNIVSTSEQGLKSRAGMLNALSPLAVLSRGYSIVTKNNKIVSDAEEIKVNDDINLRFNSGLAIVRVIEVKTNE